jgi:transcriptional regulator with XRE-family HTH domain
LRVDEEGYLDRWEEDRGAAYWRFRRLLDDALVSLASHGVTARQIAAEAGVSEATLSKWRHGDRPGDRARVERVSAAVLQRLEQGDIRTSFSDEVIPLVDRMFPVRLDAVHPEPQSVRGGLALSTMLWSIPLVYEVAFLAMRFAAFRRGGAANPLDDGPVLSLAMLLVVGVAVLGPFFSDRRRYSAYVTEWARRRGLVVDLDLDRATPTIPARAITAVLTVVIALEGVIPDLEKEVAVHLAGGAVPSWAEPAAWPFFTISVVVRGIALMDLVLLALWRVRYWVVTVQALTAAGRFTVVEGRSDGGWWPPLRVGYTTLLSTAVFGLLARQLAASRSIELSHQTSILLLRVLVGVLLIAAITLLYVLHRGHEHNDPGRREAMLLNLSPVPAAIVAAPVLWIVFAD